MLVVDSFGHLAEKARHLIKHGAQQGVTGREINKHGWHRHLGFARDFRMMGRADSAARKHANRASQQQGTPLGFIERPCSARRLRETTTSHGADL
jgi:hypothetical protein